MALDRQKILSELGSVMNQLQSADCGCMGKLFSNQSGGQSGGSMGNHQPNGGCGGFGSFGGCRGGCCHSHGGFNFVHGKGSGEPSYGSCASHNNPRKMYADTYNYLDQNLMQPVVKEVYNDLKTITPENTVMGNNMAAKLGFSPQGANMFRGNAMQGENQMGGGNSMQGGSHMQGGSPMQGGNPMQGDGNPMQVGYMQGGTAIQVGSGIQGETAMLGGGNFMQTGYAMQGGAAMQDGTPMLGGGNTMEVGYATQEGNSMQGGNMMARGHPMLRGYATQEQNAGMQQNQIMASHIQGTNQYMPGNDMPGAIGFDMTKRETMTPNQMNTPINNNQMANQNTQQMMNGLGPNIVKLMQRDANGVPQSGQTAGGMNQGQYNPNAGMTNDPNQQMLNPTTQYMTNQNNAMGANMQGQISPVPARITNSNPAAQQMSMAKRDYGHHTPGMKKFNEMFPGLMSGDLGFDPMAVAIDLNPGNHKMSAMNSMQKMMFGDKVAPSAKHGLNAVAAQNAHRLAEPTNQQNVLPEQGLYGQPGSIVAPAMVQNQQYSDVGQEQQYQYQQQIDPNAEAPTEQSIPQGNEEATNFAEETVGQPSESRTNYHYNTLGQPVDVFPAKVYHSTTENTPRSLSGFPPSGKLRKDIARFSNVKSTISRTSLVTNKPLGKAPSRNQLQNIYNQYKGSQSFVPQNTGNPSKRETTSEGRLGVQRNDDFGARPPIERVGDTLANNEPTFKDTPVKDQVKKQHLVDTPAAKEQHGDAIASKASRGNCRNGLQDMVYTQYPTSAAWTFHGESDRPNYMPRRAQMFRITGSTTNNSGTKTVMTNPRKR